MIRVSLAQNTRRGAAPAAPDPARPMLHPAGAQVILGDQVGENGLPDPVLPTRHTMFGPRGVCIAPGGGPLFVADTGHHRVLIWHRLPEADNTPADLVIGQPDMFSEGRNGCGPVGPATLNMPVGLACDGRILAVADAWNHRVLIWKSLPRYSNQPADLVLGQADFSGMLANRGAPDTAADRLNWCYGVSIDMGRMIVADTGNRRVLIWNAMPTASGQPADLVLGQIDMVTRDDNASGFGGAVGMRWPHNVVVADGRLLVADVGNNRIMAWNAAPNANGAPCSLVLGQPGFDGNDQNRANSHPNNRALNMPYGLAVKDGVLLCADTANSRLLGYPMDGLAMDAPATGLAGQCGFADKGDNRWRSAARDSLCWPFGMAVAGETLAIADTGNNRVLLWRVTA